MVARDARVRCTGSSSRPASSASRRSSSGPSSSTRTTCFPALSTIAAVLAFLHERERTTYVLLALAVAAKVYPVVLAAARARRDVGARRARCGPPRARVVRRRARARAPAVRVMGPGGLRFSYWVQLKRGLEVESLGGGVAARARPARPPLRRRCATRRPARETSSARSPDAARRPLVARRRRRGRCASRGSTCAAGATACSPRAAAVTAFVAFGKVLSPQYVVWLVPLVPASGPRRVGRPRRRARADPRRVEPLRAPHGSVEHWGEVLSWWILARDLVLVALFVAARAQAPGGSHTAKSPLTTPRVARAAQERRDARLDVAAEHEHVRDVAVPLRLAVVRRVDAEIVRAGRRDTRGRRARTGARSSTSRRRSRELATRR